MMNYQFSEHLIFRTPLKPVKLNFSDDELVELFNEKVAKEALFLASPSLYQAFEKWQENRMHSIKTQEKLFNSLRKYALRMHNRATPFGLFASCGTAQWAKTASEPIRLSAYYRRTKLDMHYSVALSQYLDKQPYIQPYLHFYPNSSIYLLGNEFRYIEYYYQNHKRIHQISAVDASVYVRLVLEKAQNGATIHVLSEHITNENIALEEAKDFIQLMIDAQLLVSELEPTVSGGDLMDQLIHTLGNIEKIAPSPSLHRMLSLMVTIQKKLNSIDQFMGNAITDYHHIIDLLAEIGVAYEVDKLFQTDLFTAHQAHYVLPSAFQPQLRKVLKVLNCLQPAKELPTLQTFITKFQERYETQSIPLLTALDTETGVGYGDHLNHSGDLSPLIQEMIVPTADEDRHITLNQENAFLFSKLQEAQRNQAYSINLSLTALKDFQQDWEHMPDSLSVLFSVLKRGKGGAHLMFKNATGPSNSRLLGRFASGNSFIHQIIKSTAQQEAALHAEAILAEIVHLPENRIGNVLIRPSFRAYEIPYLSMSSRPTAQQISLQDIYVYIEDGKLKLKSKQLNRTIIPRMANAHHYSVNALPVYHFLCDFQHYQKKSALYFDWGPLQEDFKFLPRVMVDQVIVEVATWRFQQEDFNCFKNLENKNFTTTLLAWKSAWRLPDLVMLTSYDHELLIDLTDSKSTQLLIEIASKQNIILKEYLYGEQDAMVQDANGNAHTNEFIATFIKTANFNTTTNSSTGIKVPQHSPQRTFLPGSEWIYFKLYSGTKTADLILKEAILPLLNEVKTMGWIDQWFFIRYADPDPHLRIRFHLTAIEHLGSLLNEMHHALTSFQTQGLLWKLQTDTYVRELERYDSTIIAESESIFCADSNCTLQMIDMMEGDQGEDIRWQFAIKSIDQFLEDFNFSLAEKNALMTTLAKDFGKEFGMNRMLKKQLDERFRKLKDQLFSILDPHSHQATELSQLFNLVDTRSQQIHDTVQVIYQQENQLTISIADLLASHIHMICNRIFRSQQRLQEMVVYDYLSRIYQSGLARQVQYEKK